ncbi:hypothetical protein ETU10_01425 [Apibacter muscae]|uniref:hypothetical protein n=1 Tax=Apibacter muscae TaxID=2509004 RepID=UPI0011AD7B95|nr:hypothetical protein [Apibacter muscae]TWP24646.1 hypothetical protein ETU10_01425 [Apibacter muscae]
MKNRLYLIVLLGLLLSCIKPINSQHNSFNSILDKNNSLNDSIKKLVYFDYPKKWYTHIDETPFYDSVKDSLSQRLYDNLSILEDSIYNSLKIDKKHTYQLKKFDDTEIKNIYKKMFSGMPFKWDSPYFVATLEECNDYILNIYKSGDKYDDCGFYYNEGCKLFVVRYLLMERITKKDNIKKYWVIYSSDNVNIEGLNRFFYFNNKNNFIILDFYHSEIEKIFLGRKEYNIDF